MKLPKYYRNLSPCDNDTAMIISRLKKIPESKRDMVRERYSELYISMGTHARKHANDYLNGMVKEYAV